MEEPNFNPLRFYRFCVLVELYFRKYEKSLLEYDDFIADVTSEAWLTMEKTPFKDIPELHVWLKTNIPRISIENKWNFFQLIPDPQLKMENTPK